MVMMMMPYDMTNKKLTGIGLNFIFYAKYRGTEAIELVSRERERQPER